MLKKIVTGILTVCMVLSASCLTVFAVDTIDLTENSSIGISPVEYTVDSSWNARIPALITPCEQGEVDVKQYSVQVSDVILEDEEKLVTRIEYDGKLVKSNGVELSYTIYDANGDVTTGNEIISVNSDNSAADVSYNFGIALNETPKYAGTYTGKVTFNFATAENKIVYTAEDIENNEHLFAIGETKPEYVVAELNDDYTEVTMFANGDESDGIMKSFSSVSGASYSSTLKKAVIKEGITNISSYTFYLCKLLECIEIPDSVTSIDNNAFGKCSLLESIIIPESVTYIGTGAFSQCKALQNVEIGDNVTAINNSTFYYCTSLKNVKIGNSVTKIGMNAFNYCSSLETIDIPDSVTYIDTYVFSHCSSLKSAIISKNVTSINNGVFSDCSSLESVYIPDSVESISKTSFSSCYNLQTVYGHTGSYAETWAYGKLYNFVAID